MNRILYRTDSGPILSTHYQPYMGMKGITMATNTRPRMTARQLAAAKAAAARAKAKAKAKAEAEAEAEAEAKAETETEADASPAIEAEAEPAIDRQDYSSYVDLTATIRLKANAYGQLDKGACRKAVLIWNEFKAVFPALDRYNISGFGEFQQALKKAMDDSAAIPVKVGTWEGTTRQFLQKTPTPREVRKAEKDGTLIIGRED